MNRLDSLGLSSLPREALRRLDQICDRFEEAIQGQVQPRIKEFLLLAREGLERQALLGQLLLLEWVYARQQGEVVDFEKYHAMFPEYEHVVRLSSQTEEPEEPDSTGEFSPPTVVSVPNAAATVVGGPAFSWRVRGYVLIGELGRGGMGTVHLARHVEADRLVALKVLQDRLQGDAAGLARFKREARLLARIQHPNIVPVFEVGEHCGLPFYSMEYCPGGSLAEFLRGRQLLPRDAAALLETLARAISAAHGAGIIHRDLKPGNVLLESRRHSISDSVTPTANPAFGDPEALACPKLADFGLARRLDNCGETPSMAVLGTPEYMAPEQAEGGSKRVGPAADVYGLGAILYECLTGRPPFKGNTSIETLMQVISRETIPPSRLRPKLPTDLETICIKCLEKEPRRRYASAAALADDLDKFQRGVPIDGRRPPLFQRCWNRMERRPAVAALFALLFISGLAALLTLWAFETREWAVEAYARAEDSRRQAQQQAAKLLYDNALQHMEAEGGAAGLLWLARAISEAKRLEASDIEERSRRQIAAWGRDAWAFSGELTGHTERIFSAAYSPDGKLMATGDGDGKERGYVCIWDAATLQQIGEPLYHAGNVYGVAFSPDCKVLLTGCEDHTARLWDVARQQQIGPIFRHQHRVLAVAFSPDGRSILTGSEDKTAKLWDAGTGEELASFEHPETVRAVAFSPDGTTILTGSDDKHGRLWDVSSQLTIGEPLQHQDRVHAVAFSPDESKLATGSNDKTAQIWDARTLKRLGPPLKHADWVMAAAFSPDSRWLLTGCLDRKVRLWQVETARQMGLPIVHSAQVRAIAVSPDAKTILTTCSDTRGYVWRFPSTLVPTPTMELKHTDKVKALAFSNNDRMLLTGGDGSAVRLFDVKTGELLVSLLKLRGSHWNVAFSRDDTSFLATSTTEGVRVWDTATGKQRFEPGNSEFACLKADFSPDGKKLLVICMDRKKSQILDATTGIPLEPAKVHESSVLGFAFRPDGSALLAVSGDYAGIVLEAATGKMIGRLRQQDTWFRHFEFSSDATAVLAVDYANTARVWDFSSGSPLTPPMRHQDVLYAIAWSRDGKFIVTGSYDKTARLWEADTGRPIGPPLPHPDVVDAVAISPNNTMIGTGCDDRVARLWKITQPLDCAPQRIQLWLEVMNGLTLTDSGTLQTLDPATWSAKRKELDKLGGPPF